MVNKLLVCDLVTSDSSPIIHSVKAHARLQPSSLT